MNSIRNEDPLKTYRQEVEKLARNVYLQTIAIRNEVYSSKINPEDRASILLHAINLLTASNKNN
jgi:hypothetical protein